MSAKADRDEIERLTAQCASLTTARDGNTRKQRDACDVAAIQRARFAAEERLTKEQARSAQLERGLRRAEERIATLEREAREGAACIERLQAALEGKR